MYKILRILQIICVTVLTSFVGTRYISAQKLFSVEHEYQADVKVFVVDAEYKADLVVFKTDKDFKAKKSENKGLWYICPCEYQADKKIFFVERESIRLT